MTPRDQILARFPSVQPHRESAVATFPLYLPDLSLWYERQRKVGALPAGAETLGAMAAYLGAPVWVAVRPWRQAYEGMQVTVEETESERAIHYPASDRTLTARWTLGPDGDWWQIEYPVKSADDLPAAREVVAARRYHVEPDGYLAAAAETGEAGVVAIELPMRPYSDLLHTLLGWGEGLMLFASEGAPILHDMLGLLEERLHALVALISPMPGDLVLSPDNLDGQYISPRVFKAHFADSYRQTADVLHKYGKSLLVHAGGTLRRLLPLLPEAGVDGVEGIAGPPQGDATLAEARMLAGPNMTLWGGIAQDLLLSIHSEDDYRSAVRRAASEARNDPRMIVGVADRVSVDSDLERLRLIPQLVRESI